MATHTTDEISSKVAVRFSDSETEIDAETNREVVLACAMQIATIENEKAMLLRDQGKIEEAKQLLLGNSAYCLDVSKKWGDEEIAEFGANNAIDADNLDGEAWGFTRKAMRADQFKNNAQIPSRRYNSRHAEAYQQQTIEPKAQSKGKVK